MHLLPKDAKKKTYFLNEISSKNLNVFKWSSILVVYINNIHHEKIHPRIPLTTLVLKYICNVFKL
jgi:hypothetical protein